MRDTVATIRRRIDGPRTATRLTVHPRMNIARCSARAGSTSVRVFSSSGVSQPRDMASDRNSKKLLVLGGTGFVGSEVCRQALASGFSVVSVSRRGGSGKKDQVDWRAGDIAEQGVVQKILDEGGFLGVVHTVGLLFDADSGMGQMNRLVSGVASVPSQTDSYDRVTRQSALNAIDAASGREPRMPFVFVSAAEAGWPDVAFGPFIERWLAPSWLHRYLEAKRAVEHEMLKEERTVRGVIFRPSLIWTWSRLSTLPMILILTLCSMVGLPFVDRPVRKEALGAAIIGAIQNEQVVGVKRYTDIQSLCQEATGRPQ